MATSPSIAIVETIAAMENADPVSLSRDGGITLSDFVDPEALDALFADGQGTVHTLTVSIDDYTVRIEDNELVVGRTRKRPR